MNRNSKHLEPRHPEKRPGFDKDQPSEPAGPANPDRYAKEAPPSFDEGGQRPAPIESTGNDGVRSAPPPSPASHDRPDDTKKHTEATMPPGQGVEPKRHTM